MKKDLAILNIKIDALTDLMVTSLAVQGALSGDKEYLKGIQEETEKIIAATAEKMKWVEEEKA